MCGPVAKLHAKVCNVQCCTGGVSRQKIAVPKLRKRAGRHWLVCGPVGKGREWSVGGPVASRGRAAHAGMRQKVGDQSVVEVCDA